MQRFALLDTKTGIILKVSRDLAKLQYLASADPFRLRVSILLPGWKTGGMVRSRAVMTWLGY